MNIKSLRLFCALAEMKSFITVAEKMHTVQSNVSSHIQKLENELEIQLVDRTSKQIQLTSAGWSFLEHAKKIIRSHDEALAIFKHKNKPQGKLKIGSMETTLAFRLPTLLTDFYHQYPDIQLEILTGTTLDLQEQFFNGDLDCIFVAGRYPKEDIYQKRMFHEELVLVSAHILENVLSMEVLRQTTFLAFKQGCSYRQSINELLAYVQLTTGKILEFGSLDAILACVQANMGMALLPKDYFAAHQSRYTLSLTKIPEEIAYIDTYLLANQENTWSPELRTFTRYMESIYASIK